MKWSKSLFSMPTEYPIIGAFFALGVYICAFYHGDANTAKWVAVFGLLYIFRTFYPTVRILGCSSKNKKRFESHLDF